jgi:hypothetical protein
MTSHRQKGARRNVDPSFGGYALNRTTTLVQMSTTGEPAVRKVWFGSKNPSVCVADSQAHSDSRWVAHPVVVVNRCDCKTAAHVERILDKLGVASRAQIAVWAVPYGGAIASWADANEGRPARPSTDASAQVSIARRVGSPDMGSFRARPSSRPGYFWAA